MRTRQARKVEEHTASNTLQATDTQLVKTHVAQVVEADGERAQLAVGDLLLRRGGGVLWGVCVLCVCARVCDGGNRRGSVSDCVCWWGESGAFGAGGARGARQRRRQNSKPRARAGQRLALTSTSMYLLTSLPSFSCWKLSRNDLNVAVWGREQGGIWGCDGRGLFCSSTVWLLVLLRDRRVCRVQHVYFCRL